MQQQALGFRAHVQIPEDVRRLQREARQLWRAAGGQAALVRHLRQKIPPCVEGTVAKAAETSRAASRTSGSTACGSGSGKPCATISTGCGSRPRTRSLVRVSVGVLQCLQYKGAVMAFDGRRREGQNGPLGQHGC